MALVKTYLGAAYWSAATSAPTLASVSLNAGDLLVAFCLQDAPFAGRSVSSATWGASGLTSAVELVGNAGAPYDWMAGAAFYLQAGSTASNTITFNLSGNAAKGAIVAYKFTGFNTSAPIGDTDNSQDGSAAQTITLSGASGDIALYGVTSDNSSADRWLEGNNSITADYNADARPGTSGVPKIAAGSKDLSGASVTLGFTSRGFDAGPIDVAWEKLAIGLVIQQAAGGAGDGVEIPKPLNEHRSRSRKRRFDTVLASGPVLVDSVDPTSWYMPLAPNPKRQKRRSQLAQFHAAGIAADPLPNSQNLQWLQPFQPAVKKRKPRNSNRAFFGPGPITAGTGVPAVSTGGGKLWMHHRRKRR